MREKDNISPYIFAFSVDSSLDQKSLARRATSQSITINATTPARPIITYSLSIPKYCSIIIISPTTPPSSTHVTNALTRNILEPIRTLVVWIASIVLYYATPEDDREDSAGEAWTNWSYMEAGGFVLITIGVLTYNYVWTFPCFKQPPKEDEE